MHIITRFPEPWRWRESGSLPGACKSVTPQSAFLFQMEVQILLYEWIDPFVRSIQDYVKFLIFLAHLNPTSVFTIWKMDWKISLIALGGFENFYKFFFSSRKIDVSPMNFRICSILFFSTRWIRIKKDFSKAFHLLRISNRNIKFSPRNVVT